MQEVLAKFGNMSSATVFFVLRHFLDSNRFRTGDLILSTALGPGFSSEVFLGRCENGAGLQAVSLKNARKGLSYDPCAVPARLLYTRRRGAAEAGDS